MHEYINERVSAITSYNRDTGKVVPAKIRWQAKIYTITSVSYYHKIQEGKNIQHIFHVTDGNMDFKLKLDSETLRWTLMEVTDGT
jgi:hypothetical protein